MHQSASGHESRSSYNMGKILYSFLCSLTLYSLSNCDELLSAIVIYRHGDRTPVDPYPNDPYRNESLWPCGFGQLTNVGKLQHYELGQWFRNRYQAWLPALYSEKDIFIRSTDLDRTLMSAEANLAGLYPPVPSEIFKQNLSWLPIPVHTVPTKEDNLIAMNKSCPKFDKLQQDLMKTDLFIKIQNKYQDLYAYLTENAGSSISNPETVEYLYNTLYIETLYNFTLPKWTKKVYPDMLTYLSKLSFVLDTFTPDLARLKAGPLVSEIVQHFKNVNLYNSSNFTERLKYEKISQKFVFFSGHDTTVASVLNSLNIFPFSCPPYTSTVMFELKKSQNQTYVQIFYKTLENLTVLKLPNCEANCDFDKFVQILKPLTLTEGEWKNECNLGSYNDLLFRELPISGLWGVIFFSAIVLLAGIICGVVGVKCLKRKRHDLSYTKLPDEDYA